MERLAAGPRRSLRGDDGNQGVADAAPGGADEVTVDTDAVVHESSRRAMAGRARLSGLRIQGGCDESGHLAVPGRVAPGAERSYDGADSESSMDVRAQMERIYGELPLDEIPWNLEEPPQVLVDLVASGRVAPCRTVDLGCGAGNYAVWLALKGFEVTGIDLSAAAIALAQALAR